MAESDRNEVLHQAREALDHMLTLAIRCNRGKDALSDAISAALASTPAQPEPTTTRDGSMTLTALVDGILDLYPGARMYRLAIERAAQLAAKSAQPEPARVPLTPLGIEQVLAEADLTFLDDDSTEMDIRVHVVQATERAHGILPPGTEPQAEPEGDEA